MWILLLWAGESSKNEALEPGAFDGDLEGALEAAFDGVLDVGCCMTGEVAELCDGEVALVDGKAG